MIELKIDEEYIEERFYEELTKRLNKLETRTIFWDTKELCRQTGLSVNTVKELFFYDERFPKYKVGGKWKFPAIECEKFLLEWIKEQPTV